MDENIDFALLRLAHWTPIQLHYRTEHYEQRYRTRYLGCIPGVSILVTMPSVNESLVLVREGQPFVVRVFAEQNAIAFGASVLRVCSAPGHYLHLEYPKRLEAVTVRAACRVPLSIIATVELDAGENASASVMVRDISLGGALLESQRELGKAGQSMRLSFKAPVLGADMMFTLDCELRNQRNEDPGPDARPSFWYGVRFLEPKHIDRLGLKCMVEERLAAENTFSPTTAGR